MKLRTVRLAALLIFVSTPAHAELFSCKQADGSVLYTDQPGPGCREVLGESSVPLNTLGTERSSAPGPPPAPPAAPSVKKPEGAASHSFPPARRSVPSLLVGDLPDSVKGKGFYQPNRGDIVLVEISVSHLQAGGGPSVVADTHFRPDAVSALRSAVSAAAKATGYDTAYLQVRMALPAAPMFDHGYQVDGPSAGVGWTIAVASSILGDPMRPDVCLTGTMGESLQVGKIGGVEYKIEGCHRMGLKELIFPAGQSSFELDAKRQSFGIKLTPVSMLAEAYEAATGQPLRRAR